MDEFTLTDSREELVSVFATFNYRTHFFLLRIADCRKNFNCSIHTFMLSIYIHTHETQLCSGAYHFILLLTFVLSLEKKGVQAYKF